MSASARLPVSWLCNTSDSLTPLYDPWPCNHFMIKMRSLYTKHLISNFTKKNILCVSSFVRSHCFRSLPLKYKYVIGCVHMSDLKQVSSIWSTTSPSVKLRGKIIWKILTRYNKQLESWKVVVQTRPSCAPRHVNYLRGQWHLTCLSTWRHNVWGLRLSADSTDGLEAVIS